MSFPSRQRTVVIIKPDAVAAGHALAIMERPRKTGLCVLRAREVVFAREQMEALFEEHQSKAFYHELVSFMSAGPSVVVVLAGPDAIHRVRAPIGATEPAKAVQAACVLTMAEMCTAMPSMPHPLWIPPNARLLDGTMP